MRVAAGSCSCTTFPLKSYSLSPTRGLWRVRSIYGLRDSPQYPTWVNQCEIAHSPILVLRLAYGHTVFLGNLFCFNLGPPGIYVVHEKVHLQVLGEFLDVVVLE